MSRMKIAPKAWRAATDALLYYLDNKREYEEAVEEAMASDPERRGSARDVHPDPTAAAAIRLSSNRRVAQLTREIEAVEEAVSSLRPEEKVVIRKRFWEWDKAVRVARKPRRYEDMLDTGYEITQQRRIVQKVVYAVARNLGAI